MIALLVILPLIVAAFFAVILRRRTKLVRYMSLVASIISLLIAVSLLWNTQSVQSFVWFSVGNFGIPISTTTGALNMTLLLIVAGITPLIFTYSIGYLKAPSEQGRYYFEMCIFAAAMMLFAISANFITLFIAWEMLGLTSYLLIGFWQHKPKAQVAARKAITTIIIGDTAMLIAILLIWVTYQTFEFTSLLYVAITPQLYVAMLLIAVAAFTKSAQFPFTEWLADAMEGPTPVSAFLHSSTMVKAGVFLILVLAPIYAELNLLYIFIIFGVVSALIGATNALSEHHIKRILAYSTMEDLALMFIAIGFNALYAAMLLFVVQAFYKALLFMSAGSIMHAGDDEEDLFESFNSTKSKGLFFTMLIGTLSLAGVFPFSGFFGKVAVDSVAANFSSIQTIAVYIILSIIDLISSIYIFRWLFVPMRKASLDKAFTLNVNYRTLPKSMLIPAIILAVFVVLGAIIYVPLTSLLVLSGPPVSISLFDTILETVIVLAGIGVAYVLYVQRKLDGFTEKHGLLHGIFSSENSINSFYLYFVSFVDLVAKGIWQFDHYIDQILYYSGKGLVEIGNAARKLQNGQVNLYVAAFMLGLLALVILYAM
jgi:NADH-quinone oxidoreductase subunit L